MLSFVEEALRRLVWTGGQSQQGQGALGGPHGIEDLGRPGVLGRVLERSDQRGRATDGSSTLEEQQEHRE